MSDTRKFSRTHLAAYLAAAIAFAVAGFFAYPLIQDRLIRSSAIETSTESESEPFGKAENTFVKLSEQACDNLGLWSEEVKLQTYWRKIQTSGVIVDRPGFTDRGITSPVDCVVSEVHAFEGDIVRPGDKLFTLRLVSEYLQQTQSKYFKALSEIKILQREIDRIGKLTNSGVIPEKRTLALQQNIDRQKVEVEAVKQELLTRGFNLQQIREISAGKFIRNIEVVAPSPAIVDQPGDSFLEMQNLKIELGQQVAAGELLAMLANHQFLYVNGFAFKNEATHIARAAEMNWPVEIEFLKDDSTEWGSLEQVPRIRHLSNTIDTSNRTFDFFIPLTNQSRSYQNDGRKFVIWRFRPGQPVRIEVPVEKMENVIVVPSEAVVFDGPDSYVFQQNGELYQRIPVHVLEKDRHQTVLANDGSVLPGIYLAQNSAASLNRVLKVQTARGETSGNFHVHADGSVHANH